MAERVIQASGIAVFRMHKEYVSLIFLLLGKF
jgi:hypothetical protein